MTELGSELEKEATRQKAKGNDEFANKLSKYGEDFEKIFSGGQNERD